MGVGDKMILGAARESDLHGPRLRIQNDTLGVVSGFGGFGDGSRIQCNDVKQLL